ncbi:hypothetical protein [Daejeonella lutea]|uniref:DUF1440 domain-containing protein n=1 Tax=Daejeonella lutea TaxID=572036 RepID=A0A1T5BGG5_9SPHI|nr:hypothetical protein [Daejeonella lutea]SKB46382.1 hypothetical protein SAMN05661099_1563 [Daejeonella lutea]
MKNLNQILKAGLLVGTLDILAACLQFILNTRKEPSAVFKFIASGVFGARAFSGGYVMAFAGLIFHYLIALAFTVLFFFLYPKMHSLIKNNVLILMIYGTFVWLIMKFLIIPLSNTPSQQSTYLGAATSVTILIICVGIPLSIIAERKTFLKK